MNDLFGSNDGEPVEFELQAEERELELPGNVVIKVRETSFHPMNANKVWPGTLILAQWLVDNAAELEGKRLLELGAASGVIAIFLQKISPSLGSNLTTSDYADDEIEDNIAFNCKLNNVAVPRHFPHTWGTPLPEDLGDFDVLIANDILLYVNQYPNLVKSIVALLRRHPKNYMILSCQRRIGDFEHQFMEMLAAEGLHYVNMGKKVYRITQ